MSNAVHGYGTQLQMGDGIGGYTTVAEVTEVGSPKVSANMVDVTNMMSTSGWREKLPTLLDGGDVSFKVNYLPADATHDGTAGFISLLKNRTRRSWKIILPDAGTTTWVFDAYVSGFEGGIPLDGVLTASLTLAITGAPTLP